MAFVFTVEDGTGLSSANSYVSVEEADDIIAVNIHASGAWSALAVETKEKLLAWSTSLVDNYVKWNGTKSVETSALRWPRTGAADQDGVAIGANTIPTQLKLATANLAIFLSAGDRTIDTSSSSINRVKVDVIELEFAEGTKSAAIIPPYIAALLRGLGAAPMDGIRFARLRR